MTDLPVSYPVVDAHVHAYSEEAGRRLQAHYRSGRTAGVFGEESKHLGTPEEFLEDIAKVSTDNRSGAVLKTLTPTAEMAKAAWDRLEGRFTGEEGRKMYDSVKELISGRIRRRNAWGNEVSKKYPSLANFITVDPNFLTPDENVEELELRMKEGAKGFCLHPTRNLHRPEDLRLYPLYERAQEMDVPVITHTGSEPIKYAYMGLFSEPNDFIRVLDDFPRLRWIFGHMGNSYLDQIPAIAKKYDNVWFETSGTLSHRQPYTYSDEVVVDLIRTVGVERVMWGSDWVFGDIVESAKRMANLPLKDSEKELVFGGNALKFLGM